MNKSLCARAWAEIDLDNLVHNYKQVQSRVGHRQVMCVIKADAYGHGAPHVAKAFAAAGATRFAVATPEEALQLRRHGIEGNVLLLGAPAAEALPRLQKQEITVTLNSLENAQEYAKVLNGCKMKAHIKVDTGMSRQGVTSQKLLEEVRAIAQYPCFDIEGLYTHLAAADDPAAREFTQGQIAMAMELAKQLKQDGLGIPLLHIANSAGILAYPDAYADMVRPGIVLYGSNPCNNILADIRPGLSLYTRVVQVRRVPKGQSVGYGRAWVAPKDTLVAVLGIGYADGVMRGLSGKMHVLLGGVRVPQVGRICMDLCMVDVTNAPGVQRGDVATLIGRQGEETITADEVAAQVGTISYEVFCAVGRRLPRVYVQNGKVTEDVCYVERL